MGMDANINKLGYLAFTFQVEYKQTQQHIGSSLEVVNVIKGITA